MKHFLVYMVYMIQFAFGFVEYNTRTSQIICQWYLDTVMSVEEDDLLIQTSFENSINFEQVWESVDNIDSFLHRDDYISVRGTSVEDPEDLNFEFDIDGVTILWKEIGSGLSLDYTHLDLASRGETDLKPIYPLLRKHIKLQEYTERGLDAFRHSVGCQLIYHGGWETWLGFMPRTNCDTGFSSQIIRRLVWSNISRLRIHFQKELKVLLETNRASETLAKNNIFNMKKLFVLPSDRRTILNAFQNALQTTDFVESTFYPIIFSFRFGEKCRGKIELPILDINSVEDICIHSGICVSSHFHDLFWCRSGVNEVIGERGRLTSAFSFFECVNFQSNLDKRLLDVSGLLRSVSLFPENLRFVQLYSDMPHRRPQTAYHPITGSVIMLEGILPLHSQQKLLRDANEYLSELKSNFYQVRNGNCRLEFVVCLPSVWTSICAEDLVNRDRLHEMFQNHAIIAPFSKICDLRVLDCLREIGMHLHSKLKEIFETKKGTGDSWAVWQAYQYELAAEKLLWGHPFCGSSRIYAVNLGPGLDYPTRSLSDQMGFICLENCFSCCSSELSTPPLNIFASNPKIQTQVTLLFGISDLLNASAESIGKRIILCLLKDLHENGTVFMRFEDFMLSLKASTGNGQKRIVGGVTIRTLSNTFINAQKCKWPMVFKSLQRLFNNNSKLENAMHQGIQTLKLGYFPAVRNYDSSRSEGLNWRYTYGYWVLSDIEDSGSNFERLAGSFHVQVLTQLEQRKLCHSSAYENNVFPWIRPCLEKIPEKKLTNEEILVVITYVTCICLLMNNRFIDYLNLSRLERALPLPQRKLQVFEILSKFKLDCIKTVTVFRVHPSIPHNLDKKRKLVEQNQHEQSDCVQSASENEECRSSDKTETETIPKEDNNANDNIQIVQSRHIPTNKCRQMSWKPEETAILTTFIGVTDKNLKQLYTEYQGLCRLNGIPDHPFDSFRKKMFRINTQ